MYVCSGVFVKMSFPILRWSNKIRVLITCVEIPICYWQLKKKTKDLQRQRNKQILNIITFTQNNFYIRIKKKTVNQLWYYCDLINVNNQGLNLGK